MLGRRQTRTPPCTVNQMAEFIKQGVLLKQPVSSHYRGPGSWRSRVITLLDDRIEWCKVGQSHSCGRLRITPQTAVMTGDIGRPFVFSVGHQNDELTLKADSAASVDAWQVAIEAQVAQLTKRETAKLPPRDVLQAVQVTGVSIIGRTCEMPPWALN